MNETEDFHKMIDKGRADSSLIKKFALQAKTQEDLEWCRKALIGIIDGWEESLNRIDRLV